VAQDEIRSTLHRTSYQQEDHWTERSAAERISGFVRRDRSAEELIDCEEAAEGDHDHKQRPARAFAQD